MLIYESGLEPREDAVLLNNLIYEHEHDQSDDEHVIDLHSHSEGDVSGCNEQGTDARNDEEARRDLSFESRHGSYLSQNPQ